MSERAIYLFFKITLWRLYTHTISYSAMQTAEKTLILIVFRKI